MTTTTTHTPASLLSLHRDDPRKLDALAAEIVMGYVWRTPSVGTDAGKGKLLCTPDSFYGKHPHWVEPSATAEIWQDSFDYVPIYSADLNAAAMLEARLAERGIKSRTDWLREVVCPDLSWGASPFRIATKIAFASAKDRTIAAVLAAQEAK